MISVLLARAVRSMIADVTGLPPDSVRPKNQKGPAGGQGERRAAVQITRMFSRGEVNRELVDDGQGGTTEAVDSLKEFEVSIDFYGTTKANQDPAGLAKYSTDGFDLASELDERFRTSHAIEQCEIWGLCYMGAKPAVDLTGVDDANYLSRGHVDLTFTFVNRVVGNVSTILSTQFTVIVQKPDGTIEQPTRTFTIEVSP